MIYTRYIKHGILSGLLTYTIMFTATADSYQSVFAQITPAPIKFGSDDDATDSSQKMGSDTNNINNNNINNNNLQGITPSEKLNDATEETTNLADSNDVSSEQTTTGQDDKTIISEEQDHDPTNQLVGAIMD